tara:strand:- start:546 stop:1172 length:627 start_codon:yes stop_codon:yes gene_type:complete
MDEKTEIIKEAVIGGTGEDTSDEPTAPVGGEPAAAAPEEAAEALALLQGFMKDPAATSIMPETKESTELMMDWLPGRLQSSQDLPNFIRTVLRDYFLHNIFKDLNNAAESYYQDDDQGAGGAYMAIRRYIEEKVSPTLEHYDLGSVPDIALWVTTFEKAQEETYEDLVADGASVPKFYNNDKSRPVNKMVIGLSIKGMPNSIGVLTSR